MKPATSAGGLKPEHFEGYMEHLVEDDTRKED